MAIPNKLNTEIHAALKLQDVQAKLEAAGIEIRDRTPQEYAALIKAALAKWGRVVIEAGIQPKWVWSLRTGEPRASANFRPSTYAPWSYNDS